MCGIIAILRRPAGRTAPPSPAILDALDRVLDTLRTTVPVLVRTGPAPLDEAARNLDGIDRSLRGTGGLACLLSGPGFPVIDAVASRASALEAAIGKLEMALDTGEITLSPGSLEAVNACL